jgi:tetratricopeptide (TPR) repeat protein
MKCDEFKNKISLFFEGKLDEEELADFSDHSASCDKCEKMFMDEYEVHNTLEKVMAMLPKKSPSFKEMLNQIGGLISKGLRGEELQKKTDKIFDSFREKVVGEISPENIELYVKSLILEAKSYQDQGNIIEAIKCYEEALELKPGDEKIKNLILETKKSVFEVIVGGEKQTPEWEGNQAYISISKPCKVKFIRDNKILSEKIYNIENFRGSRLAAKSHGETTPSKKQLEVIYSDKDITIQLEKGSTEGKFIITLSMNE